MPVEVQSKSKWAKATPKKIVEVEEKIQGSDKVKMAKRFVYDAVQPKMPFLRDHYPKMDDNKSWLKLWRDMLWTIPRGIPATRNPYNQRAANVPCKEGQVAWENLAKVKIAADKNQFFTAEVASSLWLGAQSVNAESVPFLGRAEQTLLLHFWPLTVMVFQPQQITSDGKREFAGYTLAIPEVSDLSDFVSDYPDMLQQLSTEVQGYRPAEAIIDLPAQSALSYLEQLARLTAYKTNQRELAHSMSSVEYVHLHKVGKNIKCFGSGRVAYHKSLIHQYRLIVGQPGQPPSFRNPLFRRGLLLSLLNPEKPTWYEPMVDMMAKMPWPIFVRSEKSPQSLRWFWVDAQTKFQQEFDRYQNQLRRYKERMENDPTSDLKSPQKELSILIYQLVKEYVARRTEDRSGMSWDKFKDNKIKDEKTGKERINVPKEYSDAKEKVASGLFLELRSRHDQSFVSHFTGTLCAYKQFLNPVDFQTVSDALLQQTDNVKALTLLALSANS